MFLIRPPRERGDEYKFSCYDPCVVTTFASEQCVCTYAFFSLRLLDSLSLPLQIKHLQHQNTTNKTYNKKKQPAPRNIRNRQKKFDGNINKRGNVSVGKAGEHVDDPPISRSLIAFFVFVVVGSSIVQILRMFQTSVPNLSE